MPLGLTATNDGKRQINLSWIAPSDDGGADITGYRIEVSADRTAWSNLTADTGATDTTHSHTDLNVETTLHYRVSAINSAGTGKSSSIATGITAPATVPEAPSGLTATRDEERRIDLSWTAPYADGGAEITGYRIEVSTDGSAWSDLVVDTENTATTYSQSELNVETTRHYRVSAINSAGTGKASNAATGMTAPATVSGVSRGLTATKNVQRQIDLSWSAPSDDGGADVTGYRIEVSTDGSAWSDLVANTENIATSHSHTGLRGETTRHYRVLAINSAGTGPASNVAIGTTAPATVPDAPTELTATVDLERRIDLSWSTPANDGGANITGYRVQVSSDNSTWIDLQTDTGSTDTAYQNTELRGGTTRHYRVSAINTPGTGPPSNTATGATAPATAPGAPSELTTTQDVERRIDLSWTPPSDDGGADITGYRIEVSEDGLDWSDLTADTGVIETTHSHTGLRGGATRHYRITAINSAGVGEASNATTGITAPATVPAEPTGLTATTNWEKWIDLSWMAPSDDGGADVTGYRIEVSLDGSTWSDLADGTESTDITYSHMGLRAEITRHYRVSAINSAGVGTASDVAVGTTILATPTSDRTALIALYNAADGANWANNKNWLSDAPMRDWFGVITDRTGRVTGLSLEGNRLSGQIPPELANLSHLTSLKLYENQMSGQIPPQLGNLTYLVTLNLYQNQLSGKVPPELGSLSYLEKLALTQNQLSGEIPPELGDLSYLESLHLGQNQLSGEMPPELGNLPYLRTLALEQNQLTGGIPPLLGSLSKLELLYLQENQLSGEIPPELGSLPSLELLYLRNNQLSGEIPPELGNLSYLASLSLGGNQLTGCVPWGFGHIKDESFVGHQFCSGQDQVETSNTAASDRAALVAIYRNTDGPNWKQNGGWLSDAPIGEWFGVTTDGNGRVIRLDLDTNWLDGKMPPQLGNLSNLRTLSLRANRLSGKIPPGLGNLSFLRVLDLSQNQLSGHIPSELTNLLNLRSMALSQNRLSGEIPPQLGNLSRLEGLELAQNKLSGEIPTQLGKLSYLTYLSLYENRLRGSISPQLGNLSVLAYLRLNDNRLRGEIPSQLGSLSKLERLNLEANDLTGRIPPQLGSLFKLEWLSLNNNRFSGEVPPELGGLFNLTRLRIGGTNRLAGCIPGSLGNVPHNDFDETGLQPCEGTDIIQVQVPATQLPAPPASLDLDLYYEKHLDAGGIPVAASSLAPDEALFRVRDIISEMLSERTALHDNMARLGVRVAIMPRGSAVSNLPEFRESSRYWDTRVEKGGLYSRGSMRLVVIGEENLLCQTDDVRKGLDVFVHEFAHAVDHAEPFSGFRARLVSAYKDAMSAGLWPATYASTNPSEYWAQAVGIWFGLGTELHLNTRAELLEYDPAVAALIQQVFGDAEISSSCNLAIASQGTYTDSRSGDLSCFLPECKAIYSPLSVSFYNFSVEVTFANPTRTDSFEYGFSIAGVPEGGVSDYIEIRVTNSGTWNAYIQKVVNSSVQVQIDQWRIEIGGGDITVPFDTSVGGSNLLDLIVIEGEGCLHANGNLISCFDISGRASTGHIFISSEGGDVRYYGLVVREITPKTE